ncbi:MAG: hypothetical protein LBM65_06805 [Oscillospiraceae bacterium]|jgi:hypothetical protein|nr:hypothetical protein [Oscillospiraceae bacterium]
MKKTALNYLPYAVILFALFMVMPMFFISDDKYASFLYILIFPGATILCAFHYSWHRGLDFLFALISPVLFLPSMFMYNGNDILIGLLNTAVYLVCGIVGSFLGDIVYSDEKKKQEKEKTMEGTVALTMERDASATDTINNTTQGFSDADFENIKDDVETYDAD